MESGKIFSSELIDIIFENRNKDYGAYVIRKGYDNRLRLSFLIMSSLLFAVCCFYFLNQKNRAVHFIEAIPVGPELKPAPVNEEKKMIPKKENPNIRSMSAIHPPVLVKQITDKPVETNIENIDIKGKPNGTETPNIGMALKSVDSSSSKIEPPVINEKPEPAKPLMEAEIMPEFPGGVNALIKYLQNNLKSPEELDENDTREVRIKFVVDISGALSGLDIIKSGGQNFDAEVIRVVKKMPKWKPGKNHDQSVSVYFSLPVKFTSAQ